MRRKKSVEARGSAHNCHHTHNVFPTQKATISPLRPLG
jgi:hypothetical protein